MFRLQSLAHTFHIGGGKGDLVEAAGILGLAL
jgi:hypothetical protein